MSFREEKYERWMRNPGLCKKSFEDFVKKGQLAPISGSTTWGKRHIEKANHNLDFATLINDIHGTIVKERFPKQTFYDWSTIAYYYAVYHAALAMLSRAGYRSKSHMATLCGIILHYYHKNRVLEKRHIEILKQIGRENIEQFIETQKLRERASYGVSVSFEERLSTLAKNDAIEFVEKAKETMEDGE